MDAELEAAILSILADAFGLPIGIGAQTRLDQARYLVRIGAEKISPDLFYSVKGSELKNIAERLREDYLSE